MQLAAGLPISKPAASYKRKYFRGRQMPRQTEAILVICHSKNQPHIGVVIMDIAIKKGGAFEGTGKPDKIMKCLEASRFKPSQVEIDHAVLNLITVDSETGSLRRPAITTIVDHNNLIISFALEFDHLG